MKESSTHVDNSSFKQLQWVILLDTKKGSYLKESNTLTGCNYEATVKGNFARNKRALHEGVKYSCGHCNHQATQNGHLDQHKRSVHEEVNHSCRQCNHQVTTKGNLTQQKRVVHERVKFSCRQFNYQATEKGNLDQQGQYMKESNTLAGKPTINQL